MIRICHVQLLPLLSSVQRAMLDLFQQLDRSRYEIHVVCKREGPLTQELARLQIPVHFAPSLQDSIHPWHDYQAFGQLRRIFAEHDFQIVHTHSSKPGFLGRLAARRSGVPIVIHDVHGLPFNEFTAKPRRWFYEQLERYAAHQCDCMVFANNEERELAVSRGWIPPEHCLTIFKGVDLGAVHPDHKPIYRQRYRAHWEAGEDEFVILFLGRLSQAKQPLLVAEIAARLDGLRSRKSWRLLIAGAGPYEAQLAQAVKGSSISHRVKMLGRQNDPTGLVHAADVVLSTSLFEALPRTLIEAQAAGVPIVASNARGTREVVTPGTGFLCPIQHADSYAEALARLIDSPELRIALGQAGRRHAEDCFDVVANNRQLVAVYESLLAS